MMNTFDARISQIRQVTPVIREFTLEPREGHWPGFSAGSHIQVRLPVPGHVLRNAYSLIGDPGDDRPYRIAVRLHEHSRGGSRYLHESVHVGDILPISAPVNLFALHSDARHHVLMAGGIGITPFLSYLPELNRRGASYELHYASRSGVTDAYIAELRELAGERLFTYDATQGRPMTMDSVLRGRPLGTHVYCCGPKRMVDEVGVTAHGLGWPDHRIHFEAFSAPEPGEPFVATLARSQNKIPVAADQSLLEALEQANVEIPNLCRGGVCGQCATRYLAGSVEHRDHYLTAHDRAQWLMPCVSRCRGDLVLDL